MVIRLTARWQRVNHDVLRRRRQQLGIVLQWINCGWAVSAGAERREAARATRTRALTLKQPIKNIVHDYSEYSRKTSENEQ